MRYIMTSKIVRVSAIASIVVLSWGPALHAEQAPAVKRNILLKQDMTVPDREAVMALVELPPGSAEGRHTHPAEVFAFVQEGTITLEYEGNPTVTLKAGEVFYLAPGKIHQAINNGGVTARLAAVFVAEKGKPLTAPTK
jgi:quercetin dioxygenase-like cupin family protein